jgi:hypothetical protein
MKIGFTGTQIGMSAEQKKIFHNFCEIILNDSNFNEFHHGDCLGADEDAHNIVKNLSEKVLIHIHPPKIKDKRSFCENSHKIYEEKDYLVRNRDIVNSSDILIATPKEVGEQLRSGTWATIRYAKKQNISVVIIFPDGTLKTFKKVVDNANTSAKLLSI